MNLLTSWNFCWLQSFAGSSASFSTAGLGETVSLVSEIHELQLLHWPRISWISDFCWQRIILRFCTFDESESTSIFDNSESTSWLLCLLPLSSSLDFSSFVNSSWLFHIFHSLLQLDLTLSSFGNQSQKYARGFDFSGDCFSRRRISLENHVLFVRISSAGHPRGAWGRQAWRFDGEVHDKRRYGYGVGGTVSSDEKATLARRTIGVLYMFLGHGIGIKDRNG